MDAPRDPKAAYIAEAIKIIDEVGLEHLSLRDVARRLGVSHQAPYKHFASRDHILAAAAAQVFTEFARFLDDREITGEPWRDMRSLGLRYFAYAEARPRHYRLMYASVLPPAEAFPEMMARAQHAFGLLKMAIAELPRGPRSALEIERDALFVWSTIHGLVGIMRSDTVETLKLSTGDAAAMIEATLDRIGSALAAR